jgi:hypothetical protein
MIPARRPVAATVLASFLAAMVLPSVGILHSPDAENPTFARIGAAAHHPTTQFERVIHSAGDGHCTVCHLQRTLSSAAPSTAPVGGPAAATLTAAIRTLPAPDAFLGRGFPPRGPPVGL